MRLCVGWSMLPDSTRSMSIGAREPVGAGAQEGGFCDAVGEGGQDFGDGGQMVGR